MSNIAHIEPTEFKNVRTGKISFGVRIWDNYGSCYNNTWLKIPEEDREVLQLVLSKLMLYSDQAQQIISDALENGRGLYVGETFVESVGGSVVDSVTGSVGESVGEAVGE